MSRFSSLFLSLSILVLLSGCSNQSGLSLSSSNTRTNSAVAKEHILGAGTLTFVEFADTECPYSKEYHLMLEAFMPEFEGKIRWQYKHFPLNQHMKKATLEAEALECAGEQEKFWQYTHALFASTPSNNQLPETDLFILAKELNLDEEQFNTCIASATYNEQVKNHLKQAQAQGANGTPFSLLVDEQGNVLETFDGLYFEEELREIFVKHLQNE